MLVHVEKVLLLVEARFGLFFRVAGLIQVDLDLASKIVFGGTFAFAATIARSGLAVQVCVAAISAGMHLLRSDG